jgi:hypothetical protein
MQEFLNKLSYVSRKRGFGDLRIIRRGDNGKSAGTELSEAIAEEAERFAREGKRLPASNIIIMGRREVGLNERIKALLEPDGSQKGAIFACIDVPRDIPEGMCMDVDILDWISKSMAASSANGNQQRVIQFAVRLVPIERANIERLRERYRTYTAQITSMA